jgi:flagellin
MPELKPEGLHMLSIQTNVNSLVAQENLNVNNEFQSRTITQLTSGYRINSSGDDAAGLAVANQYRNSVSELTQGVSNGNDGVAQLQIMDGGMSNISQILDRLKTLATQSASSTFTGDRGVLNNEFQTDISEIDRQAQAIGLNTGGSFAQSLGVYLGGGAGSTAASTLANGVVTVNLGNSTVDSQSLGLTGVQSGNSGYDLSTSNIVAIKGNGSNTTVSPGTTQFQIYGPGFGSGVDVNVATSAITDGASLVTAINQAITSAGVSNTAFANAGITASMTTDATTQHQVLSFTSAGTAFQVRAGDRMANAFLGNTGANGLGTALASTLNGTPTNSYTGTTFGTADALNITVSGAGLSAPVTFSQTANTGAGSAASTAVLIQNDVAANAALAAAGITVSNTAGSLQFSSATGGAVNVSITGDTQNVLGYGSFVGTAPATSFTAGNNFAQSTADGTVDLDLSLDGGSSTTLAVSMASATNATAAQAVATINAAIAAAGTGSAFNKAGIFAQVSGSAIELLSSNNTSFRLGVRNDGTNTSSLGFYGAADRSTVNAYTAAPTPTANFVNQDAKGEYQLGSSGTAAPLTFSPILYATDKQSLTVSAADASGGTHNVVVSLTQANGQNIDQAISAINTAIQGSGDSTLQQINAVKVNVSGTEKIEFESTVPNFSVNVGSTTNGTGVGSQGNTLTSTKVGAGGAADISTQTGAQAAVTAVTAAVSALGVAQAAVGIGENLLNYAVSLAQSQITNLSAAESNIRDADVAQQAANLTKAQVLQQASIAAMAQANSAPQAVLSLLKT